MNEQIPYDEFLKSKVRFAQQEGFDIDDSEINPALKPHNKLMVKWLVNGGRRACFASFGLHKTVTQLETVRLLLKRTGGRGLRKKKGQCLHYLICLKVKVFQKRKLKRRQHDDRANTTGI